MSSLWSLTCISIKNHKKPSPKRKKRIFYLEHSIEGTSPFAFFSGKLSAAMTVEAAIVLPLFFFFFLNLGSAIEMLRLHENLQLAMWDVGNQMCLYGTCLTQEEEIPEWEGVALSYTYIKSKMVHYVGENYLNASPIGDGLNGLQFVESDLTGDEIDLIVTYQVSPWLEIPFVRPFRMANRYYGRMWTGYDVIGDVGSEEKDEDVVYVTETGQVYHESLECTHLKLHIQAVALEDVPSLRNEDGGKYKLCQICGKQPYEGNVYVGVKGDAYHYSRECSGLKRTIRAIKRSDSKSYRPCSRCAA